jgi:predicted transglutaminase-like cysteine proteinase
MISITRAVVFCFAFATVAALAAFSAQAAGGRVALTADKLALLQQINSHVNATVTEVSDMELYGKPDVWALPVNGKGDCEDFALLKRKLLVERGWPASSLSITVGVTSYGEAHAWLTVATDRGDYVLDNLRHSVVLTEQTGYRTYSRQGGSKGWVSASGEQTSEPTADFPIAGVGPARVASRRR